MVRVSGCVLVLVTLGSFLGLLAQGGPLSPIRGPYLQLGAPTSIVIRWRSATPTDSRVRLGSAPGQLTRTIDVAAQTTEHEVQVSGLTPATRYFYSVGSRVGVLSGDDADHFFETAPAVGSETSVRVWVIGDSGTNNNDITGLLFGVHARAVRNRYKELTQDTYTNVWLTLGDNAYNSGTDEEYQFALFDTYPELLRQTVLSPAMGNHDGRSSNSLTESGPYFDMFTLPRLGEMGGAPSRTEAYYSFDYANVHFVCLDTCVQNPSFQAAMLDWLQNDLNVNTQDWVIAYFHHPPYSKGGHDSDLEGDLAFVRVNIVPILEDAGADLVFAGHSHSYERSFLLHDHLGVSETLTSQEIVDCGSGDPSSGGYQKTTVGPAAGRGSVYIVNGSSGGQVSRGVKEHPAMFMATAAKGAVVLDVEGQRLEGRFMDEAGALLDHFVIEKTADAVDRQPHNAFVRGDANIDGRVNVADASWVLLRLFDGLPALSCDAAGDADSDGQLQVTDAVYLLTHLFQGGSPPSAPFPLCGSDPGGGLGCRCYFVCP